MNFHFHTRSDVCNPTETFCVSLMSNVLWLWHMLESKENVLQIMFCILAVYLVRLKNYSFSLFSQACSEVESEWIVGIFQSRQCSASTHFSKPFCHTIPKNIFITITVKWARQCDVIVFLFRRVEAGMSCLEKWHAEKSVEFKTANIYVFSAALVSGFAAKYSLTSKLATNKLIQTFFMKAKQSENIFIKFWNDFVTNSNSSTEVNVTRHDEIAHFPYVQCTKLNIQVHMNSHKWLSIWNVQQANTICANDWEFELHKR